MYQQSHPGEGKGVIWPRLFLRACIIGLCHLNNIHIWFHEWSAVRGSVLGRTVSLLEGACHWGQAERFQKSSPSPISSFPCACG